MTRARAAAGPALLAVLTGLQLVDALRGGGLVGTPVLLLASALAGYVVGRGSTLPVATAVVVGSAVLLTWAHQVEAPDAYPVLDDFVFSLLSVGAPALAGQVVSGRAAQVRELQRLAALLSAQRRAEVRAAGLEERNRLQLQLHRGFSEQVAAIAMRAESAVGAEESAVRAALVEVEAASRQSLDELRGALGSLRAGAAEPEPDEDSRAPAAPVEPLGIADVALAAVCGTALAIEAVVAPLARGPALPNVLVGLLAGAALVVRRHRPLTACLATLSALTVMSAWLTPPTAMVTPILTLLVCGYTVGAHARGLRRAAGFGLVLAGSAAVLLLAPEEARDPGGVLPMVVFLSIAFGVGTLSAGWSARAYRMRTAVAELQRGREVEVQLAVAEQRDRLAGELHDTVAHAMTAICLQASAGQVRPDGGTLEAILATARGSLEELRNGLDNLGDEHDLGVADLAAQARRAGLHPQVRVTGRLDDLPSASRRLAARVVRESLTNASRYAPGTRVRVDVVAGDVLAVVVSDDGPGASEPGGAASLGAGSGLQGLAGEAARLGGTMSWGRDDRGFRVEATLPGIGVRV